MLRRVALFSWLLMIAVCGANAQSLLRYPTCVVYDSVHDCHYVTNQASGVYAGVVKIDSDGTHSWFDQSLSLSTGAFIMGDTLIVESGNTVSFFSISDQTMLESVIISGASRLYSMATDGSGYLFLSDYNTHTIYKLSLSTLESSIYVSGLTRTCGLHYQYSHNRLLVISGAENSIISAVNPSDSSVTLLVGVGLGDFDRMTSDNLGNLYVSDWAHDAIFRFDPDFSQPPVIVAAGFRDPSGIAFDRRRKVLAVPNTNAHSVTFRELPIGLFNRVWSGPVVSTSIASDAQGASWTDYDNDGVEDLFVTNGGADAGEDNHLFHNNGDGTFTQVIAGAIVSDGGVSQAASWADYDNDGYPDCFVANAQGQTNALYRNDGLGSFTRITTDAIATDTGHSVGAAWIDYDSDGDVDLVVAREDENVLYRNTSGSFVRTEAGDLTADGGVATGLSCADYDNDLKADLFVSYAAGVSTNADDRLYRNTNGATFALVSDQPVDSDGVTTSGGSWGDYDNDGDLDLFVPAATEPTSDQDFLYRNNGNGTFTRVTDTPFRDSSGHSVGSCWGDFNNDGYLDLFVANAGASVAEPYNCLYMNDGDGTLQKIANEQITSDSAHSSSVSAADYDRDGDIDLCITQTDGMGNLLYRNNDTTGGWLEVNCIGTQSNRSAIGARIRLRATIGGISVLQVREISSQTGHSGQNGRVVHFGLGDATIVDSVVVLWPDGCASIYANVIPRQILTVTEQVTPSCCCQGATGNVNSSGIVDLADLSALVSYMTGGGYSLPCQNEANVNSSGIVDLADLSALVSYLTGGGYVLPNCP